MAPGSRFRTLTLEDGFSTGSAVEVVDLTSGETRTVSALTTPRFAHWPCWSPDGQSMVVELERYESVVQEAAAETTAARAIAVIDLRQDTTTPPTIITPWDMQASYSD